MDSGSRAYYCRSKTRLLDCYAKPVEWTQPSSPDSCTDSAAEPFRLEQAMIPQQAMSNDPLSPHTPSPLPADADATVTGTDRIYLAGPQPQPVEWLWQHRLAAGTLAMISGEPGSGKTWVALATLRRAKFDIGVRCSKDGKSGAWWWTLPPPEDEYPPVNQARCSNKLLEHLEHLHETNDLFGNLAKSHSEG
jgi:hypothetical protein